MLKDRGGKWHYRFMYQGRIYAKTTNLAATRQNIKEAIRIEGEAISEAKTGQPKKAVVVVPRFVDAAKKFLLWATTEYSSHPNSAKRLAGSLSSAQEFWADQYVNGINAGRVEDYKVWRNQEHKVRDVTLRHDLHALSVFFQYAMRYEWIDKNPIELVSIPSDKDAVRMHVLTAEEEREYFRRAARHPGLHDLGRLMLQQGMRPEEVTVIRKEDVSLTASTLRIPRGKSKAARRILKLTEESRHILAARMKGESDWIFPTRKRTDAEKKRPDTHIGRLNNVHDRLVLAAREEKPAVHFDFVIYDFRHTFATRAAEDGMPLHLLAAILGHNSLRILERYVHPQQANMNRSMEAYDLAQQKRQAQWLPEVVIGGMVQ